MHRADPFAELLARWEADAATLRRRGAEREACVLETAAAELRSTQLEWAAEVLTLEQAAKESGMSYSALEKAVRGGKLRNAGVRGAPRVRRADLPRKAQGPAGPEFASRVLDARTCARRK
mgnify:CR=1 FL=1